MTFRTADEVGVKMTANGSLRAAGILRVVYKQVSAGDLRKLQAVSNDAPTGGGARDFRLPYREFDPVMRKLLPHTKQLKRVRDGGKKIVHFPCGPVKYRKPNGAGAIEVELLWEDPTDTRPTEGRIPLIHKHFGLPKTNPELGAAFFLLVQHKTEVRAHYAYERDLRAGKWDGELTRHILSCKDSPSRRAKSSVQGYIDCVADIEHCHGVVDD
ncbi:MULTISPECIES: hypothetical protein [Streptomyces]|uniref:hypothetical protein n=1 Tax=Streptomyces TaxID=1883 RepID=UPI0012FEF994|nr:hypothetical protein [Streptomyces sp. TOR3209]